MENKHLCPNCHSELILFFPNIPYLTAWYCPNNDYQEPATEDEIDNELERRDKDNDRDMPLYPY